MTDWKKLEHAHGSASDVPGLLGKLDGKVARERELAANLLVERFALPGSALPALVGALLERIADEARKARPTLWRLLVEVIAVEPQRYVFEPFALPKEPPKPLREALDGLGDARELLAVDVASADVALSAAASYLTASLPAPGAALAERLVALVPPTRANQVLYGGVLTSRRRWHRAVRPRPPKRPAAPAGVGVRLTKAVSGSAQWTP